MSIDSPANMTLIPTPDTSSSLEATDGFASFGRDDLTDETWIEDGLQMEQSVADLTPDVSVGRSARTTVLPRLDTSGAQPRVLTTKSRRYQVVKPLGVGGSGEVFLAEDQDIGRQIAIKKILRSQSTSANLRFAREIQTIGRLEHPNIVPIHDVGEDEEGNLYFVMKYVEGDTLEQIIDKLQQGDAETHVRYGFEERVRVVKSVMEAVAFAHSHGVVHRDIKPANIMVGRYGEVLLLDWGIAKTDNTLDTVTQPVEQDTSLGTTRDGVLIGTPLYMSPEQARREAVDHRSDIYALSVLLHEFLTLRHYLEGLDGLESTLQAIQERQVPLASVVAHPHQNPVPMDLTWFVQKGVQKNVGARYQTVEEMLERLQRRAEGEVPVQCPVTFTKRASNEALGLMDRTVVPMMGPLMALGTVGVLASAVIMVGMMMMMMGGFIAAMTALIILI